MEKQITLLGILYICYHLTIAAAGLIILMTFQWISALVGNAMEKALEWVPYMPINILNVVGWSLGGFLIISALPGLLAGVGLVQFRSWARILALITAVFLLFVIPVGTVLAIYAFVVLFNDKSIKLLK